MKNLKTIEAKVKAILQKNEDATDDGSVQHCAGFNINHYERRRFRLGRTDGIAAGNCYGC